MVMVEISTQWCFTSKMYRDIGVDDVLSGSSISKGDDVITRGYVLNTTPTPKVLTVSYADNKPERFKPTLKGCSNGIPWLDIFDVISYIYDVKKLNVVQL